MLVTESPGIEKKKILYLSAKVLLPSIGCEDTPVEDYWTVKYAVSIYIITLLHYFYKKPVKV